MKTISVAEFRADCASVFKSVAQTRRPILVTRLGKPVAVMRPVPISVVEEQRRRTERKARDLGLINRFADELNKQAMDGLEYQADESWQEAQRTPKKSRGRRS
jgi:prevent-host-death family protein